MPPAATIRRASYARRATIPSWPVSIIAKELEYSSLAGKTVFDTAPDSACAAHLDQLADDLLLPTIPTSSRPSPRRRTGRPAAGLAAAVARRLALADTEACDEVDVCASGGRVIDTRTCTSTVANVAAVEHGKIVDVSGACLPAVRVLDAAALRGARVY